MMDLKERIAVDPHVCHGRPCIRETRIMVSVVLDNLAAGIPLEEILTKLPRAAKGGHPSRARVCG